MPLENPFPAPAREPMTAQEALQHGVTLEPGHPNHAEWVRLHASANSIQSTTASMPLAPYGGAMVDVMREVHRARVELAFGPMHSAHEGIAVIMEELDELKAHVWTNQKRRDLPAMKREAIQLAAMAVAFAAEVCDETRGRV